MKSYKIKGKLLEEIIFLSNTVEKSGKKAPDLIREYGNETTVKSWIDNLKKINEQSYHLEADENAYSFLYEKKLSGKNIFVINFSEGLRGEDREAHMPSILELLGIPYLGGSPLNKSLVLHKAKAKEVFKANNIPTANFLVAQNHLIDVDSLKFPVFMKPEHEGSSIGVGNYSKVENEKELRENLKYMLNEFKQPILIEEFLSGKEYSIGLLGNELLPLIGKDYEGVANFQSGDIKRTSAVKYISPAITNRSLENEMFSLAQKSFKVTDCRDIARIDFRLHEGKPYVLEINAPPGVSDGSSFWSSVVAKGYSRVEMIDKIISSAIKRYNETN